MVDAFKTIFEQPRYLAARCSVLFLTLILVLFAALSLASIVAVLFNEAPENPWDAAGLIEAARVAKGASLYENPLRGHATWMYGPIIPWLGGHIPQLLLTPIGLQCVSLLSAFALMAFAVASTWTRFGPFFRLISILSVISIQGKTTYLGTIRPDCASLAVAMFGLLAFYRGSVRYNVLGIILFATAFFVKQTSIVFLVVPLIAAVLDRGVKYHKIVVPLINIGTTTALITCVLLFLPEARFYMIDLPRSYPVSFRNISETIIIVSPILLFILVLSFINLYKLNFVESLGKKFLWSYASVSIAMITGIIFASKAGGAVNSLIPFFFLSTFLTWQLISVRQNSQKYKMLSVVILCGIVLTSFPYRLVTRPIHEMAGHLKTSYMTTIQCVRSLKKDVISPFDPSITYYASGQFDRSFLLDLDTYHWGELPLSVENTYNTKSIIERRGWSGVREFKLYERGYRQVWANGYYALWQRGSSSVPDSCNTPDDVKHNKLSNLAQVERRSMTNSFQYPQPMSINRE